MVKNPPASAGDIRDTGSIPGSGRSPEEGHVTHSSILNLICVMDAYGPFLRMFFFFFQNDVFNHTEKNL